MLRYSSVSISVLSLFLCIPSVYADGGGHAVTFLYPIDGLDVHYLDSVNVSWASNFSAPKMFTFCTNAVSQAAITERVDNVPTNGSQIYIVDYKNATTCNWDLRPNDGQAGHGLNSPQFLLNATQRATPSTFSFDQATSTQSSSSSATSSPIVTDAPASASPSPTNFKSQSKKQGHTGVFIGIVIGILVGVIAIPILGFCLYRRRTQPQETDNSRVLPSAYLDTKSHSTSTASAGSPALSSPISAYAPPGETPQSGAPCPPSGSILQTPWSAYPHAQRNIQQQLNKSPIELSKTTIPEALELSTTTSRDRAVELSAEPSAHEIGPSRNENTGFNFPPEKTASC